jgi:ABC-2 type transport system ATP-binding protein
VVIDHGKVIAEGTPDELKGRVGGDVIEVTVAEHDQIRPAALLVVQASGGQANEVHIEAEIGKVTVRVKQGASVLVDTVRLLDSAGIQIGDLALRKPTLDDVFLTLTGHPVEEGAPEASDSGSIRAEVGT